MLNADAQNLFYSSRLYPLQLCKFIYNLSFNFFLCFFAPLRETNRV